MGGATIPTDIEEQNRKARQAEQERIQREQGKDILLQKGKQSLDTVELPDELPSFTINTIKVEGCEATIERTIHEETVNMSSLTAGSFSTRSINKTKFSSR